MNASGGTVSAISTGGAIPFALQVSGLSVAANGPQPGSNVFIQSPTGAGITGPRPAPMQHRQLDARFRQRRPERAQSQLGPLNVTGAAGTTVNPTGVLNIDASNGGTLSQPRR